VDAGGQGARLGRSGDRDLVFADSLAITPNGTPTITNWQGAIRLQSGVTKLLFGAGGLTTTQFGKSTSQTRMSMAACLPKVNLHLFLRRRPSWPSTWLFLGASAGGLSRSGKQNYCPGKRGIF
jgi:hypothetical protein